MPSLLSLPLTLALPPILLVISLPLALFAALTTFAAFATLAIRLGIVYIELGGALLRSYIFAAPSSRPLSRSPQLHISTSTSSLTHQRQRSRRGSTASFASVEPPSSAKVFGTHNRNDSLASLLGAGARGPTRDYEGIGGWRDEDDDPEREALWLGMNKRLDLPAALPVRRHRRSGTSSSHVSLLGGNNNTTQGYLGPNESQKRWSQGSGVWSPEALRMSPVQSRARTPSVTERVVMLGQEDEGYFGLQIPKAVNSTSGEVLVLKSSGKEGRRSFLGADVKETRREKSKNSSGESISSMGSRVTVRKAGH